MNIASLWENPHIMIVDSNRLFRERLVFFLKNETLLSKCEISNYPALSETSNHFPDGLDLLFIEGSQLLHLNEMTILSQICTQFPHITIFLMSERINTAVPTVLIRQQGLKYQVISKTISLPDLLQTISHALTPEKHPEIISANDLDRLDLLTPREIEILDYVVNGQSNKEIARSLIISESTVKVHVQNILKKFDVTSRVEAAVYAVRHSML